MSEIKEVVWNEKNCPEAATIENCPLIIAATANRNTIKLEASFTRLSPSNTVASLFGIFRFFTTDVAATASGGEIIPPSRNPKASVKPGISHTEKNATIAEVVSTNPNARSIIGRFAFQKSFHDVPQAAA